MEWVPSACLLLVFLTLFLPWVDVHGAAGTKTLTRNGWHSLFSPGYGLAAVSYIVLFFPVLLVTIAGVILPRLDPLSLPVPLRGALAWRIPIVLGSNILVFVFLAIELTSGFGIESATEVFVVRSNWIILAVLLHLLAIVGGAAHLWLSVRGTRPMPRIDLRW